RGHSLEGVLQADELVREPGRRGCDLLDDLEVGLGLDPSATPGRAAAGQADVLRDLEQPRRLLLGDDAPPDPAERVQEGALHRVLGLLARAELVQAIAKELGRVPLIEHTRHVAGAVGATYGRDCGHVPPSPRTVVLSSSVRRYPQAQRGDSQDARAATAPPVKARRRRMRSASTASCMES